MISHTRALLSFVAVTVSAVPPITAATATTDPVGCSSVSLLANSDTYVSVPFHRPAAYVGQVAALSGSTITLSGSPNFSANQFVYAAGSQSNTYYAFVRSGSKEGNYYTITANSGNTLTLDLAGDTLSGLASGDSVSVIPYWTLSTVFPAADAGVSFTPTASLVNLQTEIFIPDYVSQGINLAPVKTYRYRNSAWRRTGQDLAINNNDDILLPDSYFIVRNAGTGGVLTANGAVATKKLVTPLQTRIGAAQDNPVALMRPVPVSLSDSDLISSGAFTPSNPIGPRADELYVYDNTIVAKNKSASATYYYRNGGWRKVGESLAIDYGATPVFGPNSAVIIRKASSTTGNSANWNNSPRY